MNRRRFLAAASAASLPSLAHADHHEKLRVGIIGHSGRGDYGHGIDTVWLRQPAAKIVALADAHEGGRARAIGRLKLEPAQAFADYREMIAKAKPQIVAVCPRHVDQHCDMMLAAIEGGARGIYVEKPFVRTPAEADQLRAACAKTGAVIAVAHRNRYHPVMATVAELVADGRIGRLLEIRGRGKGDRRGGAEDLWVLGSHVFNMIHYLAGEPLDCSAVMLQDGAPVKKEHVRDGSEGLGPLAGNELHARYRMKSGVTAYFDSIANDATKNAGFGLQLVGSAGIIAMQTDRTPLAYLVPGNPFAPSKALRPWVPISTAGVGEPETKMDLIDQVVHHDTAAADLIGAVKEKRQPLCNLEEGATTVEMICAVFESHRQGGNAVKIPLEERGNALAKL